MKLILKKSSLVFKVSDLVRVGASNVICTNTTNPQYYWFLKLPSELEGVLKTLKMAFTTAGDLTIGLLSYVGDITEATSAQLTSAIYSERTPYTVTSDELRTSGFNVVPNKFKEFSLELPLRKNSYILLKSSTNMAMATTSEENGITYYRTSGSSWDTPSAIDTIVIAEAVVKKSAV